MKSNLQRENTKELGTSLPPSYWEEVMKRRAQQKNKDCHHPYILRKGPILHFFLFLIPTIEKKRIKMKWPLKFCLAQRKQLASTKWLLWLPDLEMAFFLCAKRSFPNDHYFLTFMSTLLLTTAVEIFTHTVLKRTKWSFCSCLFYS